MKRVIVQEIERAFQLGRENIFDQTEFIEHSITVGNRSYEVANLILSKRKELSNQIEPEVVRVAGYFHDFAKIGGNINNLDQKGGGAWHDLEGAHMVLTRNDEIGLVKEGIEHERKNKLIQIALSISSDYALSAEMGRDFPQTAAYKVPAGLVDRFEFLKRELSENEIPITWEKLVFADTIMRKIVQYSDLVNIGGGERELDERLDEIKERYARWADDLEEKGNYEKANYYRHQIGIGESLQYRARLKSTIKEIESLMMFNTE